MRFRNNRVPYWFPAWIDGKACQMNVQSQVELHGTVVEDHGYCMVIELDRCCLGSEDPPIRIEWMKECMEVLDDH